MSVDSMQHVLQVLPALNSGGVERGTIELATFLKQQNIQNSVASAGGKMVEQLDDIAVRHFTFPLSSKLPWKIIGNALRLSRVIKREKIDLIHVRSRAPAWSCLLASKLTGTPYISTFHGCYGHKLALKRFYNSGMLRGKATIAVSDFIAKHIRENYPAKLTQHVETINRGIDTNYFSTRKSPLSEPNTSQDSRSAIRLLMPGRLSRIKGHALLAEALRNLYDLNIELLIVGDDQGDTHFKSELMRLFSELNTSTKFIGHQKDLRPYYEKTDIVVSASIKPESFGRTIIEAQAMECLVVAPNHGTNKHIIAKQLQNGLFTASDPASLASAIRRLASQTPSETKEAKRAARHFVDDNFKLSKTTEKTLELYQQFWQD